MKKIKILMSLVALGVVLSSSLQANAVAVTQETTPQVTLSSYSIAEGTLAPGEEITLNLDFKNLSKRTNVKEMLVSYTSPNGAVTPIFGNSNQLYITNIDSDQTQEVQLSLNIADAAITDIQLAFTLQYASESNEEYSNTVLVDIPMQVEAQISVNSLYVASSANVGVNSLVSINYGNQSADDLKNVTMLIEGDIPDAQKKVVLGDLAAGEVNSLDYYVSFLDAGTQTLTISCTYEDKNGNLITLDSKDFTVQVLDANAPIVTDTSSTTTTTAPTTTEGISVTTVLLAIVSAVVLILIAAVILRTVRRNRKS